MEQARALEADGEGAKALAIYQHLLPHLEGMPAIKADLALKAGDLMIKLGNTAGALGMYETAGTQCALHGSTKGVLAVGAKIQQAAPSRADVLLSLAGQMVKHGHAGPAVDVLIQHAKQANLPEMLQELEPLSGRPSEDVRPLVQMLLEQPAASPPAAPRPAAPKSSPFSVPQQRAPRQSKSQPAKRESADDFRLETASLEDQLAAMGPPQAPPPPTPVPTFSGPPAPPQPALREPPDYHAPSAPPAGPPSFEPPPPPTLTTPVADMALDLSPPLPLSARETAAINLRSSGIREAMREDPPEAAPPPRRPSGATAQPSAPRRAAAAPRRGSGSFAKLAIPVVLLATAGGLVYSGVLPGVLARVKAMLPGGPGAAESSPAGDTPRAALPPSRPAAVPVTGDTTPEIVRAAPAPAPVRGAPAPAPARIEGVRPPMYIEGLAVENFAEAANQFRVIQRQRTGEMLTLTGRPLADTVGEPAVGEIRMDSLPGDTAVAVTNFEGYVVTVRGVVAPATLQSLLLQLVARPSN